MGREALLATAGREALEAVDCCVVQRCCRSCRTGIGCAGTATVKTFVLMSARVSRAAEMRTAVKVAWCPRQATSPKKKPLSRVERLGKVVEVVQLNEDPVDEIDAKDVAPACELHEG
eukprot:580673-Pleurochrysis_carterae.AAC.4